MSSVKTGVDGLDDVLRGGLPEARLYLVQGDPGVGKTTMSMQFLLEGARSGERCLYVTLSETKAEIEAVARVHGWDLSTITVYEMSSEGQDDVLEQENTLYAPDEVELSERMHALLAEIDRVAPKRVVIDSCSELRLLARTPLRFRRQLLALKAALVKRGATVLLLENPTQPGGDVLLQSLVHGVIHLERRTPAYGADRRSLRVIKLREVDFHSGEHDYVIRRGGVVVFPRLAAATIKHAGKDGTLSSGIAALDSLVGGGFDRGTCSLLIGPAGTGKSVIATRFAFAAAQKGERAAVFAFDENLSTLVQRSNALGMPFGTREDKGYVSVQQIDPAELSPGDLIQRVREAVEKEHVGTVVIDSLNGYLQAVPDDKYVLPQLHELLSYLRQHGVVAIIVIVQHGLLGSSMNAAIDVSYLADTILMLRHFEADGHVRKAISVLKRRTGRHENTIRELIFGDNGVTLGPPLVGFRGILTGVPTIEPGAVELASDAKV